MRLELDSEQREIAAVAAKFLSQEMPLARVRSLGDDASTELAVDEGVWKQCAAMGWFALGIPEARGGVGYGVIEEYALFRELGRHLAPGPFAPTVIAGWIASSVGDDQLATALFEGQRRAGLATETFLLDVERGGLAVEVDENGARVREVGELSRADSVDPSVRLSTGSLGAVVAESSDPLLRARAQILYSGHELGVAEAVKDMSIEYAKVRHQFGKPIGTFQAVKHRCADMATRVHAGQAQTLFAAMHVARRAVDASFHAAAAKLVTTNAAKLNCADNVQNHGAIGFTVEHDAGLFARRAHMCEFALGGKTSAGPTVLEPARHLFHALPDAPDDWFAASS
jgi:alkylation response protein AidB-like acyl-CoA dehydrogenase